WTNDPSVLFRISTTKWRSCTQKSTSSEALRSFNVVLEVRVSSPIGVLRNTIPALVRHTDPRNSMKGSIVTGSAAAGVGGGVSAAGGESISAGSDGSSARTGPRRVKTSAPAQKA